MCGTGWSGGEVGAWFSNTLKKRKYKFIDLFNSLNLIEDSDGLLKVKVRLENSALQLPILLNKVSHLTKLSIW